MHLNPGMLLKAATGHQKTVSETEKLKKLSLVGGIFIVTGVLSFAFGQEPVNMMWRMVATGAGICLLPQVGKWAVVNLTYLTLLLTRKVKLLRA